MVALELQAWTEKLVPGKYVIAPAVDASAPTPPQAEYLKQTGCDIPDTLLVATTGSFTITDITSDHVAGTYDVRFDDGTNAHGAFDVPICAPGNEPSWNQCQ